MKNYGASLQLRGPEDFILGYDGNEFPRAIDSLELAYQALEKGIHRDIELAGEEAPYRVKIISRPEYYVNGTALGNVTYLNVNHDSTHWYSDGEEPKYVENYKYARTVAYLTLLDHSLEEGDFSDMVGHATASRDPYIAKRLLKEVQEKEIGSRAYAFTPQYVIDMAEDERHQHNDQVKTVRAALRSHAEQSREARLNNEVEKSDHPLFKAVLQGVSIRRHRGLRGIIREEVKVPLDKASLKPIIEVQILRDVLGERAQIEHRM